MNRTAPLIENADSRAVGEILGRVGDKWTVMVVVALGGRPHRFNELKRQVGVSRHKC